MLKLKESAKVIHPSFEKAAKEKASNFRLAQSLELGEDFSAAANEPVMKLRQQAENQRKRASSWEASKRSEILAKVTQLLGRFEGNLKDGTIQSLEKFLDLSLNQAEAEPSNVPETIKNARQHGNKIGRKSKVKRKESIGEPRNPRSKRKKKQKT